MGFNCAILFLGALVPIQSKEAAPKPTLNQSQARKMLLEYFAAADGPKKDESRSKILAVHEEDRKVFAAALGHGSLVGPQARPSKRPPSQPLLEKLALEGAELPEGEFLIFLPKRYKEKVPMPLVFDLHGSGDDGKAYSARWRENPLNEEFIGIVPTIPSKERDSWRDPGCRAFVDKIYRYMLENFAVDTDRVYVAGFSAGGAAAFFYPQSWPHRFAGFVSRGRLRWNFDKNREGCMAALRHVPGFFLVGLKDDVDRVESYQVAEKYYKEHGFPGVFHFEKGRGHEYMGEFDRDAYSFLLKQRRVRCPKSFSKFFFLYGGDQPEEPFLTRQYWLEAKRYDHFGTSCAVEVRGNSIDIRGKGLKQASLYLNDGIVDLDQPVDVHLNGEEAFRGKVERSLEFLLADFEKNRDPKLAYWNKVDLGR